MQITVTFGTGDDVVKMTDQAESVPAYLDTLSESGWQIDQITEITTLQQTPRYTVREQCLSDDPADIGPALKSFHTWIEARNYSEKLLTEDGFKSYVSTITL